MKTPAFFKCTKDDGVFALIDGNLLKMKGCLGNTFEELDPSKSEGAGEKHLPYVKIGPLDDTKITCVNVSVGSMPHPMTAEHSIGWIYLETCCGGQLKYLEPDHEPSAVFLLNEGETPIAAYAYCNLHGFWKTMITFPD